MATSDENQPRVLDYLDLLGPGPMKKIDPEDKETLEALFRRVRDFQPMMLPASAPTVELTQEMKDLIEFTEWAAGKEIPKWHRNILLGMERNSPRVELADLMIALPISGADEAGKTLTITRSKHRTQNPETNYRVGFTIDDIKDPK